jgi:hypothetical protein
VINTLVDQLANRLTTALAAPPVPQAVQRDADAMWQAQLGAIDLPAARERFLADGEFIVFERLVPTAITERALAEVERARATRSWLPNIRSAQHVGWRALQRIAPLTSAIYRSPVFLDWMSALVGRPMLLKDPADDHACATYEYDRTGDHMKHHYDTCGCDENASYSQLLSLFDRSSQRVLVDLHTKDRKLIEHREIQTPAGTLVVFCGSKVWHGVSTLGPGERRVILSMSYASDPSMPPWRRLYENVKDAVLYFGPGALWKGSR